MQIIKKGDLNKLKKIKRFECDKCGCIFEADQTEYKPTPGIAAQRGEGDYRCVCPYCKNEVWI